MYTFTHYKFNETELGTEVILYLDENVTEFASEFGASTINEKVQIEEEAVGFIKRMLPSIKVSSVKVMVGTILLTTIGFTTLSTKSASASMIDSVKQEDRMKTYYVVAGDTLSGIAGRFGTTVQAIMEANNLNTDLLRIGQTLTIPSGSNIKIHLPSTTYQVVSGDTLSEIARDYGTTVETLMRTNHLSSDVLQIGQTLTIPSGANSTVTTKTPTPATPSTYQVVSGDTLSGIAKQHGTTVDAIKQHNNLSNDLIRIGQTLVLPNGLTSTQTNNTTVSVGAYQVVAGDTLSGIAKINGTTVDAIKRANNLSTDFLSIGQTLTIPSANTTSSSPPISPAKEQIVSVNQEDVEWLAKMIFSEARGESLQGQIAVGAVIMNRVKSPLFPNSVKEVLFEVSYGYYQFTPAETGSINHATPNSQHREAALRALNGEDPTNGSLYFYNPTKTNSTWLKSRTVSTVIGNHTFAY